MRRADEPTDVYWENLAVTAENRLRTAMVTYTITLLILGTSFVINLIIGLSKDRLEREAREAEGNTSTAIFALMSLINIVNSIIISMINFFLGRIVRVLSDFERHDAYTKHNFAVALKLMFAMFVNTGLIPLAVNYNEEDWFTSSGLATDIFFNVIAISFFGPLLYIWTPTYVYQTYLKRVAMKQGEDCKLTQRQLNALYEGQPIDLAQRYSNAMLLLMICLFYVSLLPILPFICLGGAIYQYWIFKWMLVRHHKTPQQMGSYLDVNVRTLLPFVMFLYGLGQYYFVGSLSDGDNWSSIFAFIATILYLIVPLHIIEKKFDTFKVVRSNEDTYLKNKQQFEFNYEKCNPVSFDTQDGISDSFDLDRALEEYQQVQSSTIQKSKTKRMNFNKLVFYGVNKNPREIVWEDLIDPNLINSLRMNAIISQPTFRQGAKTSNHLSIGNFLSKKTVKSVRKSQYYHII